MADDPHLSVDALMKDNEEEIRRMDMLHMFKMGMDIMGDADSASMLSCHRWLRCTI